MTTISDYFEQAQLSIAAYALNLLPGMSGSTLTTDYINSLRVAGMTQPQAEEFAKRYSVVDQYTDFFSGFSGTVFADEAGNKYVAIRGSETGFFTGIPDWLITNGGDIGQDGIAIHQGIALFNWLQRLYGSPGQPVVQYYYDDVSHSVLIGPSATATGELLVVDPVSQNLVPVPVTVTGHSMGGHVAMMMSRLAPSLVEAVYTFNAPGFDTSWRTNLFPLTSDGFFNLLINAPIGPITGAIGTDCTRNRGQRTILPYELNSLVHRRRINQQLPVHGEKHGA